MQIARAYSILHPIVPGEMLLNRLKRMIEKKGRNSMHYQMIGNAGF
jgi:hypothetical protein